MSEVSSTFRSYIDQCNRTHVESLKQSSDSFVIPSSSLPPSYLHSLDEQCLTNDLQFLLVELENSLKWFCEQEEEGKKEGKEENTEENTEESTEGKKEENTEGKEEENTEEKDLKLEKELAKLTKSVSLRLGDSFSEKLKKVVIEVIGEERAQRVDDIMQEALKKEEKEREEEERRKREEEEERERLRLEEEREMELERQRQEAQETFVALHIPFKRVWVGSSAKVFQLENEDEHQPRFGLFVVFQCLLLQCVCIYV